MPLNRSFKQRIKGSATSVVVSSFELNQRVLLLHLGIRTWRKPLMSRACTRPVGRTSSCARERTAASLESVHALLSSQMCSTPASRLISHHPRTRLSPHSHCSYICGPSACTKLSMTRSNHVSTGHPGGGSARRYASIRPGRFIACTRVHMYQYKLLMTGRISIVMLGA
jgi:hypothetical protein